MGTEENRGRNIDGELDAFRRRRSIGELIVSHLDMEILILRLEFALGEFHQLIKAVRSILESFIVRDEEQVLARLLLKTD